MADETPSIARRLDELADRLSAVEARLGIPQVARREAALDSTAPVGLNAPPAAPKRSPLAPAVFVATAAPLTPPVAPPSASGLGAAVKKLPAHLAAVGAPSSRRASDDAWSFERLVGGRLYAIVGSIILVIAAGLFLKLAVDNGWLSMPPVMRCIVAGVFGVLLVGLGEFLRKKIDAWASAGISAAGVGVMYAAGFAAYHWAHVINQPTAFALLVLVSAIGIAVSLRSGIAPVAILSLVGAYFAPILLNTGVVSPVALPVYLLALLALGLALAVIRPSPFRVLRWTVLAGTFLLGTAWWWGTHNTHPYHVLGFLGAGWVLIHAEMVLGARRLAEGGERGDGRVPMVVVRPSLNSIATTGWATCLGVLALQWSRALPSLPDWSVTAAAFIGTFVLAQILAGNLRVMLDKPESDHERLGAVLLMQAAGLLIASVALALSNQTQVIAWLGMGVAAVAAGRWMRARGLDAYGLVLLSIGTARLIAYDSWRLSAAGGTGPLAANVPTQFGLALSLWSALMLGGAAAWIAASLLLRRADATPARVLFANLAAGIGLTVAYGSILSRSATGATVILGAVALFALLVIAGLIWRSRGLIVYAAAVLPGAVGMWACYYIFEGFGGYDRFKALLGAHPGLLVALIMVATALVAVWRVRRKREWGVETAAAGVMAATAGAVLLAATSFEVARGARELITDRTAQSTAVTVWWGLFAIGLLILGFMRGWPLVRHGGLGLLGVAAAKAMIFDLAGVSREWRIVSLFGLGVLMLGVAVGYAKVSSRLARKEPETEADPGVAPAPAPIHSED